MNKVAILLLMVMIPITAMAAPQIAPLNKHQKAPFAGVLYNAEAVAEMVAWKEALTQQHELFIAQLKESLEAQCTLQVENLGAELDGCSDRYDQMLAIKNDQVEKLETLALNRPNKYTHWFFAGGVVLGILTTIGITYAVNK
tara:strand:- start:57 stop:482 length:426 start_codon:yes stop_codon:yes gene_type:complete